MVNAYKRHFASRLREFPRCLSLLLFTVLQHCSFCLCETFGFLAPACACVFGYRAQVMLHASCWRTSPGCIMRIFTRHE
ncbi:hypothetical protein EDB85DRAFT_2002840 [Lactarius pseudohatsudake]|nr:hypothetical protein EDB85DRAFT_2031159 [Lactarius pseudohatsudake]KAH9020795.1 hypothetical protein EDB85DRAFT_2002840 [Lactarius pseudohatsudake]